MECAERLANPYQSLADGQEITRRPALSLRGIKFNLPFAPFDEGEPFSANEETCLQFDFWRDYIDMLARHRFNCLSLWSEHPWHVMVVSPKFRAANAASDEIMADRIALWRAVMRHARNRGVGIWLFTWNVRILPEVAAGLGLPEAAGDFSFSKDRLESRVKDPMNAFRQGSPVVRDYVREMVLQTLKTYPDLAGLGTSASEWMAGGGRERQQWIIDTYVAALKESGRDLPFIQRTNMQSAGGEIKELLQPLLAADKFYISWKYFLGHCYSHPRPQWETMWKAWDGVDLTRTQVLFTIRNDDSYSLRWADPEYVRDAVRAIVEKSYVKGFYWGADGYVWAGNFSHTGGCGHDTGPYDWSRQEYQLQLWGRLGYDPYTAAAAFERLWARRAPAAIAPLLAEATATASKLLPAVNRQFWRNYDYQWFPENCLSHTGFVTVEDVMNNLALPGSGAIGLAEWVDAGDRAWPGRETPPQVLASLDANAAETDAHVERIRAALGGKPTGEAACVLHDLQAWAAWGRYFACKFRAAIALLRHRKDRRDSDAAEAIAQLEAAVEHWRTLASHWETHYRPFMGVRVKLMTGYTRYEPDVRRDVELARAIVERD
jgi:hypothetical protein